MSSAPSRSSEDDALDHLLDRAADEVLAALAAAPRPVALIDGRSGAGKTTLTRRVADGWSGARAVQVLALDSIYPGWDGLRAGAERALRDVLVPYAAGLAGSWRRWDWERDVYAEVHTVDPDGPLVIEGAGVLTAASAALADVRVWLEAPEASRRGRALGRDGDAYRPHWERWAAQERVHVEDEAPAALATHVFVLP